MKKRILFFLHNGVGGAERMTINIANLLLEEKYDIIICKVCTPIIIQNGKIDDYIPKEIKITNIFWDGQLSFLRQLYRTITKFKPDIVFSSVFPYNLRLLLLKPFFKHIKFIVRNDNYLFTLSKIKRNLIKYSYKKADKIIAQTEEMKEELVELGLDGNKIQVLPNFIDEKMILKKALETSPFTKDSTIRFVSVGRFSYQKGFDILIKAFKKVIEAIPNSELYIIGSHDGDNEEIYTKLTELINHLDLDSKVYFTGYTDNPYKYIKNASAYVLSSRFEGLPNVLIEAQFLNVPAAATNCIPIISRIIKNGENGWLAENENPESLAKAMISAVKIKDISQSYHPSKTEDFTNLFK